MLMFLLHTTRGRHSLETEDKTSKYFALMKLIIFKFKLTENIQLHYIINTIHVFIGHLCHFII